MFRLSVFAVLSTAAAACAPSSASIAPTARAASPCLPLEQEELVFERSPGGTPEIDVAWVHAHRCHLRVVDVREPEELDEGRLAFSEHVVLDDLPRHATDWDPHAPVILVDRSGRRSGRATQTLEDLGFTRAASMTGGLLLWKASGFPVEPGAAAARAPAAADSPAVDGPLTRAQIEAHLGDPHRVRWVKAAALLLHGTQACVDGRAREPVIGTPGGDAGELVLAIGALERIRGAPVKDPELHAFVDAYLEASGRVYLHTDHHALEGLHEDERFAAEIEKRGIADFIRHPPRKLEAPLLEALTDPAHVGCGHLRLTLQHPDEYGVRRELAAGLMRAILERWWQGAAIDFVILEGGHHEGAVVNVVIDHDVHAFSRVPTFAPRIGDEELFVNHPEVSAWVRSENLAFLFEVDPWLRAHPDAKDRLTETLAELGQQQLSATVRHLAGHLPVYTAHVHRDSIRVEGPAK